MRGFPFFRGQYHDGVQLLICFEPRRKNRPSPKENHLEGVPSTHTHTHTHTHTKNLSKRTRGCEGKSTKAKLGKFRALLTQEKPQKKKSGRTLLIRVETNLFFLGNHLERIESQLDPVKHKKPQKSIQSSETNETRVYLVRPT